MNNTQNGNGNAKVIVPSFVAISPDAVPHSEAAERALLGAVLINPDAFEDAALIVRPNDFFILRNGLIWWAMARLRERGDTIDYVALIHELKTTGKLAETGGESYLTGLLSETTSSVYVDAYAQMVARTSVRRRMLQFSDSLRGLALDEKRSVEDVLADAERDFTAVRDATFDMPTPDLVDLVGARLDHAMERIEKPDAPDGVPTGWKDVDAVTHGLQRKDLIVLAGRPGMGKEQPNSALVRTVDGWKRMGDIQVGDRLASVDGAESEVTGVFPQGEKDVYEFTFSDGRTARAGLDHLWEVKYRDWQDVRILSTQQIIDLLKKKRYVNRLSMRLISGDIGSDVQLPIDPWLMGFLLGDGCLTAVPPRFSTPDAEIVDRVASEIPNGYKLTRSGKYDYHIVRESRAGTGRENIFATMLDGAGVMGKYSYQKRIPPVYLTASKRQRLELLRGLMDSDGWVESFNAMRFATSSFGLAKDVQQLVWSLGGLCSISVKATTSLDSFVLNIRHSDGQQFVWLQRKAVRIKPRKHELRLTLSSVEYVGKEESTCIQVSHPSRLYITDNYVVTHNTAVLVNMAMAAARAGHAVGILSLEMGAEQIVDRMIAVETGVPLEHVAHPEMMTQDERRRYMAGAGQISKLPILIEASGRITPQRVKLLARRWKRTHGLSLVIVDYLQLMQGGNDGNRRQSRYEEVSDLSITMKQLAMELDVPVVLAAQLSRAVEQRQDKRPLPSDLRDSGQIEQDADLIFMLYREYVYDKSADAHRLEMNLAKHRNGPEASFALYWEGVTTRVQDAKASVIDLAALGVGAS